MSREARLAVAAVLGYACLAALRPLNANDLFWHLATGREILAHFALPRTDPFSFASGAPPWIDHEWLWQVLAQAVYALASGGRGPRPDVAGLAALVVCGAVVVVAAFYPGMARLARTGAPAAGLIAVGLLGVETARVRLMVRPETASLLFLALLLALLCRGEPGWRRGLLLGVTVCVWVNVHPAALIAPVLVFLHDLGERFGGPAKSPARVRRGGLVVETALALAGTFVNPHGPALWSVPFQLSSIVRTGSFYNPEWLPPPLARFPVFYAAAGLLVAAAAVNFAAHRRLPRGEVLVSLALGALASRQMRHLGLFAISFVFAGPAILDAAGSVAERLRSRAASAAAWSGLALAAIAAAASGPIGFGLDPGRFPVEAAEAIAAHAPGLRMYNDVRFGGYLIWRFYPPQRVFIDGRNEVYPHLLARLGRIHTGEAPYDDWRALVREMELEGAIVQYQDSRKGVIYPPAAPGDRPVRGWRAWSAYLFPPSEWALVWFDDTALVFLKRGGRGAPWIARGEYRELNPEDEEFLIERAAADPSLADRLRREAERRMGEAPTSHRTLGFLRRLPAAGAAPRG